MISQKEWKWIAADVARAIHDQQIARFGGLEGVRDSGAFESALARPQNLAVYGAPDMADLAAAYAFDLARNHAFADGNKRTAWVVARLFIADNGCMFKAEAMDAVVIMENVAAGKIPESELAGWFRQRISHD